MVRRRRALDSLKRGKKVEWTYKGMAPMGDSDGPIGFSVATVNGKRLQKYVPMRRSTVYYCEGERFKTLAAALAAAR